MISEHCKKYSDTFYYVGPHSAQAIRLAGAADEYFPRDCVHITYDPSPYVLPPEIAATRDAVITKHEKLSHTNGYQFFDGPNTRLIDFRMSPIDASEQQHLYMTFGPIGWYDFTVANKEFGHRLHEASLEEFRAYVDLDVVAHQRIIRDVRLSNILCTATTPVTRDGYCLYSERSHQVSISDGLYTCGIAENIHREHDSADNPDDPSLPPVPYRTVLRGIDRELSLEIRKRITPRLLTLGLCFDLRDLHPDILMAAVIPLNKDELLDLCKKYPGREYIEGQTRAVKLSREDPEFIDILAKHEWVPSGKASLIRTLEFFEQRGSIKRLSQRRVVGSQYLAAEGTALETTCGDVVPDITLPEEHSFWEIRKKRREQRSGPEFIEKNGSQLAITYSEAEIIVDEYQGVVVHPKKVGSRVKKAPSSFRELGPSVLPILWLILVGEGADITRENILQVRYRGGPKSVGKIPNLKSMDNYISKFKQKLAPLGDKIFDKGDHGKWRVYHSKLSFQWIRRGPNTTDSRLLDTSYKPPQSP